MRSGYRRNTEAKLTERQRDVLSLIARCKTNREIADALGIGVESVKSHVSALLGKLGVDSREEAAAWWREEQSLRRRAARVSAAALPSVPRWVAVAASVALLGLGGLILLLILRATPGGPSTPVDGSPGPVSPAASPVTAIGRIGVERDVGGSSRPYIVDIDGSNAVDLAGDLAFVELVAWERSGEYVAAWADDGPSGDSFSLWVIPTADPAARREFALPYPLEGMDWAPDGTSLTLSLRLDGANADLFILRLGDGTLTRLTDTRGFEGFPRWSPDGSLLAFTACRDCGAFFDVWVMDADGSNQRNVTPEPSDRSQFAWAPRGREIAYLAHSAGSTGLYVVSLENGVTTRIGEGAISGGIPSWAPEGDRLAFVQLAEGRWGYSVVNRDGTGLRIATDPRFGSVDLPGYASFSPGGNLLAFTRLGALWIADLEDGTEHRVAGGITAIGAWLGLEPSAGVTEASLPASTTPVRYEGELPVLSSSEVGSDGWPLAECSAGEQPYRLATRHITLCVPDRWTLRQDQENTQNGMWGAHVEWNAGNASAGFALNVIERGRSSSFTNFVTPCDTPQSGTFLGMPASVCSGTKDRPNGFGLERSDPLSATWFVEIFTLTPEYLIFVDAWDRTQDANLESRIQEAMAVAETARAADLGRVIP